MTLNLNQIPPDINQGLLAQYGINLSEEATGSVAVIDASIAANETLTVFSLSPGVPGAVTSLWMTGIAALMQDGVLKVYVDGESAPSLNFDLGNLGGHFCAYSGRWSTEHVTVESNTSVIDLNYTFKYLIPFKSSIRIDYVAPPQGTTGDLFFRATYVTGVDFGIKLYSNCAVNYGTTTADLSAVNQGNASVALLNLPVGSKGWVASLNLTMQGATNETFMENRVVAYYNGTSPNGGLATPDYDTSGVEDAFLSGWYFAYASTQLGPCFSPSMFCTVANGSSLKMLAHLDLMNLHGCLAFNNGIYLTLIAKPAGKAQSTTTCSLSYNVLYYMRY